MVPVKETEPTADTPKRTKEPQAAKAPGTDVTCKPGSQKPMTISQDVFKQLIFDTMMESQDQMSEDVVNALLDMLTQAMADQKIIYVFGDYDVDGACASAIIKIGMEAAGYGEKTIVRLPKRFSEGYGVSEKAVDEFEVGQVLVTVDNGIAAVAAIKKAKQKGMQVIAIDHHLPPQDEDKNTVLPKADIIIDPKAIPGSADFDGYSVQ